MRNELDRISRPRTIFDGWRSIGIVMFFGWLGMAIGAWQGGLFYDLCGNYFQSFANASLAGVANLLILALLVLYTLDKPLTIGRFKWQFARP